MTTAADALTEAQLIDLDGRAWRAHAGMFAWPTLLLLVAVLGAEVALWWAALTERLPLWAASALAVLPSYAAFTVAHEAAHENIHGGRPALKRLNDLCGWISGVFLVAPYSAFRVIHLTHHAHTNDPERDPDHWVVGSGALSIAARCWSIVPHYYYDFLVGQTSRSEDARQWRAATIAATLLMIAALVAAVASGYGLWALALWILPAWIASGFLALVFDWLPHHPHQVQARFLDTRVLLIRGLTWPLFWQNYHLIHHLYPRVPFYRYGTCFVQVRPLLERRGAPIEGLAPGLPAPGTSPGTSPARSGAPGAPGARRRAP